MLMDTQRDREAQVEEGWRSFLYGPEAQWAGVPELRVHSHRIERSAACRYHASA